MTDALLAASDLKHDAPSGMLQRLGERYRESVPELLVDFWSSPGWQQERVDDSLEYGYRLGENCTILELMFKVDIAEADPVRALAAICEMDLCQSYKKDVENVDLLGTWDPKYSIWHIKQKNMAGGLEDGIFQVSAIDALQDELRGLWACMYTPEPGTMELEGNPLPAEDSQHVRLTEARSTYCFQPKPGGVPGILCMMHVCLRLVPTAARLLNWTPHIGIRKILRDYIIAPNVDGLRAYISSGDEALIERIASGPRAGFYAEVEKRMRRHSECEAGAAVGHS